jgi:hypothetical protein
MLGVQATAKSGQAADAAKAIRGTLDTLADVNEATLRGAQRRAVRARARACVCACCDAAHERECVCVC